MGLVNKVLKDLKTNTLLVLDTQSAHQNLNTKEHIWKPLVDPVVSISKRLSRGIGALSKSKMKVLEVDDHNAWCTMENHDGKKILISASYWPNDSKRKLQLEAMMNFLKILDKLQPDHEDIISVGDFNLRLGAAGDHVTNKDLAARFHNEMKKRGILKTFSDFSGTCRDFSGFYSGTFRDFREFIGNIGLF